MNDQVMETFGRALRRSDKETLFKLQVESSVACSQCLQFEKINLENPSGSQLRSYYVGIYRNDYPDSFLIFYKDAEQKYPKDFIWLKDSLVTSHRYVSETSLTLHCAGGIKTIVFHFEDAEKRIIWQKAIRNEIVYLEKSKKTSIGLKHSELDQIFSIEKQGCLRQASARKVSRGRPELQNLFKEPIKTDNGQEKVVTFSC